MKKYLYIVIESISLILNLLYSEKPIINFIYCISTSIIIYCSLKNENSYLKKEILFYTSISKLISLISLIFGWAPGLLNIENINWGYDPQRFYLQAKQLIDNGWNSNFLNLNYT